jgi:hypothetical protein
MSAASISWRSCSLCESEPLDPAVSRSMESCPLGGITLTSNGGRNNSCHDGPLFESGLFLCYQRCASTQWRSQWLLMFRLGYGSNWHLQARCHHRYLPGKAKSINNTKSGLQLPRCKSATSGCSAKRLGRIHQQSFQPCGYSSLHPCSHSCS